MPLYTVRSERAFCEQLDYNLLFRWFLDLEGDELSLDHSTFSRNRARRSPWPTSGSLGLSGSRSVATRATTRAILSLPVARSRSLPTWPRIMRGRAAPRSIGVPRGIWVTRSVDESAKGVEAALGWMKSIGGLRKTRYRGLDRVQMHAYLGASGPSRSLCSIVRRAACPTS
jgi:hypothetical protein